jgi:hypothetical protein
MGFARPSTNENNTPPNYTLLSQWFNAEYGMSGEAKGGLRNYLFHHLQVEFGGGAQGDAAWFRAKVLATHFVDYVEALMLNPISDMERLVNKTKEMMRIYMASKPQSR